VARRVIPALAAVLLVAGACTLDADVPKGGPGSPSPSTLHLRIEPAPYRLLAPVEREAAATDGRRIYLAGGLDSRGSSVDGVFALYPITGKLSFLGSLPQRVHDAAAALISGRLYVFGGGSTTVSDAVQSFDLRSRVGTVAGHLPAPLADVSAASIDGTTYLVGGWDGSRASAAIYATEDGTHFRMVGRLPAGLRYAAVAAVSGKLLVAGGEDARGHPVSTLSVFDPSSGRVVAHAALPSPVTQAASFQLGGTDYVVGGKDGSGEALARVWSIDPATWGVTKLTPLRRPVADVATVATSHRAWLIGGWRGLAVSQVLSASLVAGSKERVARTASMLTP
jgi:hypothetical protein